MTPATRCPGVGVEIPEEIIRAGFNAFYETLNKTNDRDQAVPGRHCGKQTGRGGGSVNTLCLGDEFLINDSVFAVVGMGGSDESQTALLSYRRKATEDDLAAAEKAEADER